MKMDLKLRGGLGPRDLMKSELALHKRAVTMGVTAATEGMRDEIRQIVRGSLGEKTARGIRARVYPLGRDSLHPAGVVSPASDGLDTLLETFSRGATISSRNGNWLAIPTRDAFIGGVSPHKLTPGIFEQRTGIKLRMIAPRQSGKGRYQLLVGDAVRGRNRKGFRKASERRIASGRNVETTVFFILVRQVRLAKRFDLDAAARRWGDRVPELIDRATPEGLR